MQPESTGTLTAEQIKATASTIIDQQSRDGMILWFPNGHSDTWNHTEAAMALSAAGFIEPAELAYQWLAKNQRPDGSWHHYYLANAIEDAKVDTNCCAYVATGVWHHYLTTGNDVFLKELWPMVKRALDFVVGHQTASGHIPWAIHTSGTAWSYSLVTGSSSIYHSLRCGLAIALHLGTDQPEWEFAAVRLSSLLRNNEEQFEPKKRWAMDWYYPVLTRALTEDSASQRMASRLDDFMLGDHGVRCVSDQPWVTTAETCECAMAYLAIGDETTAHRLFQSIQPLRDRDGAYFTGMVFPENITFPDGERSTYSSAAVILAADALTNHSAASQLVLGHGLPLLGS
ncbi:MAG TPA: prenyltransferase [Acidimicrobiaceae bacterium]|nr:prenyltransferase [Acidimicrobiaceae bacterium]